MHLVSYGDINRDNKLYVLGEEKHENIILKMQNKEEMYKLLKEVTFISVGYDCRGEGGVLNFLDSFLRQTAEI